ncbi:MAG TPA: hypothetical protein VGR81_08700 [Candidatus Acidoferrales bacterium]|nr:hypothetical protein [Candidatus Acidoferrales bacterium]
MSGSSIVLAKLARSIVDDLESECLKVEETNGWEPYALVDMVARIMAARCAERCEPPRERYN